VVALYLLRWIEVSSFAEREPFRAKAEAEAETVRVRAHKLPDRE
jgi:hypothetical protein